jgi:hypothetical protein
MTSAISNASTAQAQALSSALQQVKGGRDSDGDNDGSKPGEIEKAEPKPVSATVGNNVSTSA